MQGLQEVACLCCLDEGHRQATKDLGFLQSSEPPVPVQTNLGNQHSCRTNSVGEISETGAKSCRSGSDSVKVRREKNGISEDLRREFSNLSISSLARLELNCKAFDVIVFPYVGIHSLEETHFSWSPANMYPLRIANRIIVTFVAELCRSHQGALSNDRCCEASVGGLTEGRKKQANSSHKRAEDHHI